MLELIQEHHLAEGLTGCTAMVVLSAPSTVGMIAQGGTHVGTPDAREDGVSGGRLSLKGAGTENSCCEQN